MIRTETKDTIAILRMEHGKVNAIDLEFASQFSQALDELESSPVQTVILTGSERAFSAGVDLFRMIQSEPSYLESYLPALSSLFDRIFLFPKPMVAAVNSHAIAGGCILTCACDYRIMAEGESRIG